MLKRLFLSVPFVALLAALAIAQVPSPVPVPLIQHVNSYYALTPISSTGAANAQVTLTIPAPQQGLYNYICTLSFNYSQTNTTGTALTNAVTTSTNFNSFALKTSAVAAINTNYDWSEIWGDPMTGCPKSTSPSTATTFVSPAAATNGAFTWYAVYYQAP